MKQLKFSRIPTREFQFGGSLLVGKRKTRRPLSLSSPNHIVIKSENSEKSISFVKNKTEVQDLIIQTSRKFGIKIHSRSINYNHLHLILSFRTRIQYIAFIRVITAAIIRTLELKTGRILRGLFTLRPFSRIVKWGRDLEALMRYVHINRLESSGTLFRGSKPNRASESAPS